MCPRQRGGPVRRVSIFAPDGRFVMISTGDPTETARIEVILNWHQALFFQEAAGDPDSDGRRRAELRVVEVGGDTLDVGTPESLFDVSGPAMPLTTGGFSNGGATFHATPEGDRFLMVFRPQPQPLNEIVLVQNWTEELTRLVPTP